MDGTLANTLPSISYFANQALQTYGFAPLSQEQYRLLVGNGAKNLVKGMLAAHGNTDEKMFRAVYACYNSSYDNDFLYLTEAYDGIPELLHDLKASGFRLGVCSNKPHSTTKKIVETLFGADFFDLCCGAREGVPLKPDPAVPLRMLKDLGLQRENCLYVGDTSVDMQTGKNAGLFSIGVLWGFRDRAELEANHADLIAAVPADIKKWLETQ